MKLKTIAQKLGCELRGDGDVEITGVAGLEEATAGQLTFLSNRKYRRLLKTTEAAAVLIADPDGDLALNYLVSANPYFDFARALELFYEAPRPPVGVHPSAVVAESAELGEGCSVGACAVIGEDVVVGRDAVIHPHVTIYRGVRIGDNFEAHSQVSVREFCEIGDRVVLQNGVVVGADGYGFAQSADGKHHKIAQAGIVVIEDDVEVQANTCIDRAAVGESRIGRGTKIDNLVQLGHAVRIGEDALVCSQVGVAGSTSVGDRCILAGQVGLVNSIKIGNDVIVTAQSGINGNVRDGKRLSGSPAVDSDKWMKWAAAYQRVPDLLKRVRELERRLEREGDQ